MQRRATTAYRLPAGPPRHTSTAQCLTARTRVSTQAWSACMAYRRPPDSAEARRPGKEGHNKLLEYKSRRTLLRQCKQAAVDLLDALSCSSVLLRL